MPDLGLIIDSNRRTRFKDTKANPARFLAAFAVTGTIVNAARYAQIHRECHWNWMKNDPTYPARFAQAQQRAARYLEDVAVQRATQGVKKLVLHKGKPVLVKGEPLYETEYSDRLLEFMLKANDRKKFGDQIKMDLSQIKTINDVPPELLRLVLEKLQADYDAQQQAQLVAGDSPVPAAEQEAANRCPPSAADMAHMQEMTPR